MKWLPFGGFLFPGITPVFCVSGQGGNIWPDTSIPNTGIVWALLRQREQLAFDALGAVALGCSPGWCEGSFQLRVDTGAEKSYRAVNNCSAWVSCQWLSLGSCSSSAKSWTDIKYTRLSSLITSKDTASRSCASCHPPRCSCADPLTGTSILGQLHEVHYFS